MVHTVLGIPAFLFASWELIITRSLQMIATNFISAKGGYDYFNFLLCRYACNFWRLFCRHECRRLCIHPWCKYLKQPPVSSCSFTIRSQSYQGWKTHKSFFAVDGKPYPQLQMSMVHRLSLARQYVELAVRHPRTNIYTTESAQLISKTQKIREYYTVLCIATPYIYTYEPLRYVLSETE